MARLLSGYEVELRDTSLAEGTFAGKVGSAVLKGGAPRLLMGA